MARPDPETTIVFYVSFPAAESAPSMILLHDINDTLGALGSARYYGLAVNEVVISYNGMCTISLLALTNGVATLRWKYASPSQESLFSASNYEVAPIYLSE